MGDTEHNDIDPDPEETRKKVSTTLLHVHALRRRLASGQFFHIYIRSFNIFSLFEISVTCSDLELILG